MHDILVLAPTRWKLLRVVWAANEVLATLDLRRHPAKTFMGRVEKGFDWLGCRLAPDGLRLTARTVDNFVACLARLYEHASGRPDRAARRGEYVRRWATAGLGHRFVCHGWTPDGMAPKRNHVDRVNRSSALLVDAPLALSS